MMKKSQKINLSKLWIRIQQYTASDFEGWFKLTLNMKAAYFSIFRGGFQKILLQSYVELPTQAWNDKMKQLWHNFTECTQFYRIKGVGGAGGVGGIGGSGRPPPPPTDNFWTADLIPTKTIYR